MVDGCKLPDKNLFLEAVKAASKDNTRTNDSPMERVIFSDINPIIAGPNKKPIKPPLAIEAMPIAGLSP